MTRFYGFNYNELMSMDADIYMMYLIGINQLRNEEMLYDMTICDYPNLKDQGRKDIHKKIYKNAFPLSFTSPKNIIKLSDLNKVLK